MTFRVQRSIVDDALVLLLSGDIRGDHTADLETLVDAGEGPMVLDLKDVSVVDRAGVLLLARSEARRATLTTRVLFGDPTKSGLYTIELRVAPNTVIQAHTHRDTRTAVVIGELWYFGYGPKNEQALVKAGMDQPISSMASRRQPARARANRAISAHETAVSSPHFRDKQPRLKRSC